MKARPAGLTDVLGSLPSSEVHLWPLHGSGNCLPSLQLLGPTGMGKVFHRHLPWVACPWVHSLYIEETCAGHTQSTKERALRQRGQAGVDDSQGQKPPPAPLV